MNIESIKQFKNMKFTHEQLRENFSRDDIKELVSVFYNLEKQKENYDYDLMQNILSSASVIDRKEIEATKSPEQKAREKKEAREKERLQHIERCYDYCRKLNNRFFIRMYDDLSLTYTCEETVFVPLLLYNDAVVNNKIKELRDFIDEFQDVAPSTTYTFKLDKRKLKAMNSICPERVRVHLKITFFNKDNPKFSSKRV